MNVTVFGGTGKIGRLAVGHLLEAGHRVTAVVRSPQKMTVSDPDLRVVVAELADTEVVAAAVAGADAVLSTLGPPIDPVDHGSPVADGTRTVIAAMQRFGVRRFVALATVSVPDPRDRPGVIDRLVPVGVGVLIPPALREVEQIAEAVTTSDLDWTLVRIAAPVDTPSNGTLRAGFLGRDDVGTAIARVDAAAFLAEQVTDDRFVGAAPAISN